jgi:hypothetical protein
VAVPKALTNEVNLIQGATRRNPSLTKRVAVPLALTGDLLFLLFPTTSSFRAKRSEAEKSFAKQTIYTFSFCATRIFPTLSF